MKKIQTYLKTTGVNLYNHINRYPMESIEFLLAILLTFVGMLTFIPPIWLGQTSNVYGSYFIRMAFGLSWLASSTPIVYWRIKMPIDEYVYIYQSKRRTKLFWITITWFYFAVLSLTLKSFFPVYWSLYLVMALISAVCYIRLYK